MKCPCCGSDQFQEQPVLWKELIDGWRLAPHEVAYINRQQGFHCLACGSNLRAMALAKAIMTCFGQTGPFKAFVRCDAVQRLRVLEVNEAGALGQFLKIMPNHVLAQFPTVDMMDLPYQDEEFGLVIHSDTLEHVPHPIRGLGECRRVLKPGGFCAFTIPMVVDRLTISRTGLPPSFHGSSNNPADCLVHTEYGADAWKHLAQAGFQEGRFFPYEFPAALAWVGVR